MSFAYDGTGRRIAKTVNGATTHYVYDGLDVIQEVGVTTTNSYWRSLRPDELLVRNGTDVYLADPLGSIVALVASDGTLSTTYAYEPFGRSSVVGSGRSSVFQFVGREADDADLYFYQSRYYSPRLHRFISEDALSPYTAKGPNRPMTTALNPYAYVLDNPVNLSDPYGFQTGVLEGAAAACLANLPACTALAIGTGYVICRAFGGCPLPFEIPDTSGDNYRELCIRLFVRCVQERWKGPCGDCLHRCRAQLGEWPFDLCRPGRECE